MLKEKQTEPLFMNWHCVPSEDGTHVPKHVGEADLVFVLIKNVH